MKKIIILAFLISSLFGINTIEPMKKYESSGAVIDLVYKDNQLYSATDASCVDIFDVETQKLIKKITVSQITDFMGDTIDSKVYSVDILNNKILILSQGEKGSRRVHIYHNDTLELIIPHTENLVIAKAKFLDDETIILGLLSNEIISYNIKTKKHNYKVAISQSKFSNFVLNESKDEIIIADESGDLKIHKTKDGSFIQELSGKNLDNVFQVDTKKGVIVTAGQDRRAVIYVPKFNSSYYKKASFLIYSVGLSPSGKLAGYASDEENNITVFDTITKRDIGVFSGNKMTLTNIVFINENEFFSSSDDKTINYYQIK